MISRQRIERWCGLHGNLFGFVPVIVYQMAKVGSSSVVDALAGAGIQATQVHRMDAAHIHRMHEERRALGWTIARLLPPHDLLGLRIRRTLLDRGRRARFITLVRDPIARNISSYFEHLDEIWNMKGAHAQLSTDELIHGFRERFPHDEPLTWFDDEMRAATGIDVYEHPFGPAGHVTIGTHRFDLLILKTELANEVKGVALREFIARPELILGPANQTSRKAAGDAYRQFTAEARFDDEYLDRMLENRYTRHFYSMGERDEMRRRYSR